MLSMELSPKTKPIGLIGHPVEHSLSPKLQNHIYTTMEMDYVYLAFDVQENMLQKTVEGMRSLHFTGFNVTIPYKEKVIPLLDEIDPQAALIGAVNTVQRKDGKLIGYNTDGLGFMHSLHVRGISCKGKRILVVGAGGAARAIGIYIAMEEPECIYIQNRTFNKALALSNCINMSYPSVITIPIINIPKPIDMIINTTSLGMWPKIEDNPLKGYSFHPDQVVCDIVYNPRMTKLLEYAQLAGCTIVGGIDMLVAQAIKAIEIWTGKIVPMEISNL